MILSSFLKISRFLVLRLAFENSSYIEDDPNDLDSTSSTFSTPDQYFSEAELAAGPLLRLKTLVDRFLVRGSHTPFEWMLDLRSYGIKITRTSTSLGKVD